MVREASNETAEARERVVRALACAGLEARPYCLNGSKVVTPYTLAHEIVGWGYRLSYRLIDPDWILIGLYERSNPQRSMRDPFALMRHFVEALKQHDAGIDHVLGRVDTTDLRKGSDLNDERLLSYYLRWGGARVVSLDELTMLSPWMRDEAKQLGICYVRVDVADFELKRRPHAPPLRAKVESRS